MRKLVMLIFFILSLFTIITFTFFISNLFSFFGLGQFDINEIIAMIQNQSLQDMLPELSAVLWGLFQLYGIPLAIFLISWNGLAMKRI